MDPFEIEDVSERLVSPTRIETVKHYASILEDDIEELKRQLHAAKDKVAHGPFFREIWLHRAIISINNWFKWVNEGGPRK